MNAGRANASEPVALPRLFAERANTADLEGVLELYEPDATVVGPDGNGADDRGAVRDSLGALHPATRAAELGLWNRAVENNRLDAGVEALVEVVLGKNQQAAVRQLEFIADKGIEVDLHTAQGFEALSASLSGAFNGAWQTGNADQAAGIISFISGGQRAQQRQDSARSFWSDRPTATEDAADRGGRS